MVRAPPNWYESNTLKTMRKKPERQGKLLAKGGVCVESTLRDAFHLEYFSVMLEDATHELGGAAI